MSARLDALLAELAAAELACRKGHEAACEAERTYGRKSYEFIAAIAAEVAPFRRRDAAMRALADFSVEWAAERAQASFMRAANQS